MAPYLALSGRLGTTQDRDESVAQLLKNVASTRTALEDDGSVDRMLLPRTPDDIQDPPHPPSWAVRSLHEVSYVVDPNPSHRNPQYDAKGFPFISTQEFFGQDGLVLDTPRRVSVDVVEDQERRCWFSNRSIVFSRKGTIGKTRLLPGDVRLAVLDSLCVINPFEPIDAKFLNYALRSPQVQSQLLALTRGLALQQVSVGRVRTLRVPLPPLAEQRRIVTRVDELMKLIDELEVRQAKARAVQTRLRSAALDALTRAEGPEELAVAWQRVAGNFETLIAFADDVGSLRAAIRGAACNGWLSRILGRPERGSGEDVLRIIAKERRKDREAWLRRGARPSSLPREARAVFPEEAIPPVPSSWAVCGIDDLLACVPNALKAGPFGSALTKSMYVPSGFKVYGQEQVIPGDHRVGSYYIDQSKFESLRTCSVVPGDLLISLMGTVGRVLILPDDAEPGIINPRLLKLSLSHHVFAQYIKLYMESPQARNFIESQVRGIAMDGLNIGILRTLPVPLPPLAEQQWLVAKVDALMKLCDELEAKLRAKEATAARLAEAVVRELVG